MFEQCMLNLDNGWLCLATGTNQSKTISRGHYTCGIDFPKIDFVTHFHIHTKISTIQPVQIYVIKKEINFKWRSWKNRASVIYLLHKSGLYCNLGNGFFFQPKNIQKVIRKLITLKYQLKWDTFHEKQLNWKSIYYILNKNRCKQSKLYLEMYNFVVIYFLITLWWSWLFFQLSKSYRFSVGAQCVVYFTYNMYEQTCLRRVWRY
jgi:hypothetical protein